MGRLKILSQLPPSQDRGSLLAKIMTDVLNYDGYRIERILRVSQTGMEIDAEGQHIDTGRPFYAECKGDETPVSAGVIQAFYGKYMVRWHDDKQCHGLVIAVAGLDKAAGEFYHRHIAGKPQTTTRLYDEDRILQAVIGSPGIVSPATITRSMAPKGGRLGDWQLLYTPKGIFWIQYIILQDQDRPSGIAVFNAQGDSITDRTTLRYLAELYPELDDHENITDSSAGALQTELFQDAKEIVALTGGSEFFEYQLPASPEHFVGREPHLKKLESFANKVVDSRTSSRSILIDAAAGLGKSSLVLAFVDRLKATGHFVQAVAIQHLSSPQAITDIIDDTIRQVADSDGHIWPADHSKSEAEFEDTVRALLEIGRTLESQGKLIFVFFDQFEAVFRQPQLFKAFKELFLRVSDAQTNVVLGLALKSDHAGLRDGFDHQALKPIEDLSHHIIVELFSKIEVNDFLEKLEKELGETLNQGLRFHLAEFSQGHPGQLKKLCAQVIELRQSGVPQSDITGRLLNREERWPSDNFLLLADVADVFKAVEILQKSGGYLNTSTFTKKAALTPGAYVAVVCDMRALELAQLDDGKIILTLKLPRDRQDFKMAWRRHLQAKLHGNRLVQRLIKLLEEKNTLTLEEQSQELEALCSYLSLSRQAWRTCARRLAKWLNAADLALLDNQKGILARYNPATQIREHRLVLPRRRGTQTPQIQYSPVEEIAIRLCRALEQESQVDWTGLKKSTIFRALATLEDFGFIQRKTQLIHVLPKCFEFVSNPEKRPILFAEGALKLGAFVEFVEILNAYQSTGNTLLALGLELRDKLGMSWQESTAEKIAKILLDWSRHTKLAPGVFGQVRRGPLKGWKKKESRQISLF